METYIFEKHGKHPKCKGSWGDSPSEVPDFSCDYNSTIECEECKYANWSKGRKDPEAKCNQW